MAIQRRSEARRPTDDPAPGRQQDKPERVVEIRSDLVNEAVLFAAALNDPKSRAMLVDRVEPDRFLHDAHAAAWPAVKEMQRRGLDFTAETFGKLLGSDPSYFVDLAHNPPPARNIEFHLDLLLRDKARHTCATGPTAALLDALRDPRTEWDRVVALARQVPESLEDYHERSYLLDGEQLVHRQMQDIRERRSGRAHFPFGIDGLDFYEQIPGEKTRKQRLVPGAKPGQIVVVVGCPGTGKSTLSANIVGGMRRQGRRGLVCAWEMGGGTTIELCAAIEEGISLEALRLGTITDEQEQRMEARMHDIRKSVQFLDKAFFRKRGDKSGNDVNLDRVQGYIADSGADWVIFDLWRRMLRKIDPEEEEQALVRQQAMAEETKTCCILVQQIRLKDLEARVNKTPTRESIKGSGAWIEVPDTILATNRDAAWKDVPDDKMWIGILKQRYGKWPLAVELDYDPDRGKLSGGRSVKYAPQADDGETSSGDRGSLGKPFKRPNSQWSRGRRA